LEPGKKTFGGGMLKGTSPLIQTSKEANGGIFVQEGDSVFEKRRGEK